MTYAISIVAMTVLTVWCASPASAQSDAKRVHYEPTWESLDQHATPQWLMDAKLGLFVYGVLPTRQQWKEYWADPPVPPADGNPGSRYHYTTLAWDAAKWDPDAIAQLAADMGAKYVVFGVGWPFVCYPSQYADIEGSPIRSLRGPDGKPKDYLGEIAQAVRARGLRLGTIYGYRYPKRNPYWIESMQEVIDRYHPSTLWFDDDKLSFPAKDLKSRELVAYYYNHSPKPDEVAVEDALGSYKRPTFGKKLVHGDWYRKEARDQPPATEISPGYFVRYEELFKGDWITPNTPATGLVATYIHWLAHTAAHNGNFEIAIGWTWTQLKPEMNRQLHQIGDWLAVNGEAIYGTRPWFETGVGQTKTTSGIDVRFTTRDESLYAILLDWPGKSFTIPNLRAAEGTIVEMLGRQAPDATIRWRQTAEGLTIDIPHSGTLNTGPVDSDDPSHLPCWIVVPCDHAYSVKITPRPEYVKPSDR